MAVKYSGLLRFTDEIKAEIDLAADGAVEKAVIIDGDGVETPIGGGSPTTFTLHIVKGNGIADINLSGCMGTEDGSVYTDKIIETGDITILPYNGKARVYVEAVPLTLGDVVSADIDGDIEAKGAIAGYYLMTGNATIALTAETPQS